jgi:hypothetical protein
MQSNLLNNRMTLLNPNSYPTRILYYIILFFTIFKILNIEKIYFLKLYINGLENLKQN